MFSRPSVVFSKNFLFLSLILLGLLPGCAIQSETIESPLMGGMDSAGDKIYFSGNAQTISKELQNYAATYDVTTPEGQIDYLLARVEKTKYRLERNGERHTPNEAVEFLRWKMGRPTWQGKASTAKDFVSNICSGSRTSGKPYAIILSDNSRHNLQAVFWNELELLENFLDQKETVTATPKT